jgi:hypothetical protein
VSEQYGARTATRIPMRTRALAHSSAAACRLIKGLDYAPGRQDMSIARLIRDAGCDRYWRYTAPARLQLGFLS